LDASEETGKAGKGKGGKAGKGGSCPEDEDDDDASIIGDIELITTASAVESSSPEKVAFGLASALTVVGLVIGLTMF
jgi:hypothetical protein